VEAVDEVGNPTTLATWTVIAAILPMAFVGGLMGPYMRPIPIGASLAMLFSLFIAFVISPWAALRMLANAKAGHGDGEEGQEGWTTRVYRRLMMPLLVDARKRTIFLVRVVLLLLTQGPRSIAEQLYANSNPSRPQPGHRQTHTARPKSVSL
jgi:multidrug efflux pump subunit AcrB